MTLKAREVLQSSVKVARMRRLRRPIGASPRRRFSSPAWDSRIQSWTTNFCAFFRVTMEKLLDIPNDQSLRVFLAVSRSNLIKCVCHKFFFVNDKKFHDACLASQASGKSCIAGNHRVPSPAAPSPRNKCKQRWWGKNGRVRLSWGPQKIIPGARDASYAVFNEATQREGVNVIPAARYVVRHLIGNHAAGMRFRQPSSSDPNTTHLSVEYRAQ